MATMTTAGAADSGVETNGLNVQKAQELSQALVGMAGQSLTLGLVHIGDQLGLYRQLHKLEKATSTSLADSLGLNERFVREWLYHQAANKLVCTDEDANMFWLDPEQAAVMVKEFGHDASPFFGAGFAMSAVSLIMEVDKTMESFKTGKGCSFDDRSMMATCSVCRTLGVWIRHALVPRLSTVPGLADRLEQGIAVADIGCGSGEALITLAKRWPKSTFHGYDTSEKALKTAQGRIDAEKLPNIQLFNPGHEEEKLPEAAYDLMLSFDVVHDMTRPDIALHAICKALKPGCIYLVQDIQTRESPAKNIHENPLAPLAYAFSTHACLGSGMSQPDGLGLGALGLHYKLLEKMATDAGFKSVEQLDWEHPLNAIYVLQK